MALLSNEIVCTSSRVRRSNLFAMLVVMINYIHRGIVFTAANVGNALTVMIHNS